MLSLRYPFICIAFLSQATASEPQFNYRTTIGNDYGPIDWDKVECETVGECPGWPDGWEQAVGWALTRNRCEWCPETGNDCGLHRQSPINLLREDSTTGHDAECYDYHWMAYQDRSCQWHDIIKNGYTAEENHFQIRRHSLQILQPIDEDGNLQCKNGSGESTFPRLDYSKGFPNWWHLSHTEITVPSEHTQEGKRYDAEVHLAHFYEIDRTNREVGKVALFLEADEAVNRWSFLDKLICQWREVEEKTRDECGLDSAPPYPGCRNPDRDVGETDLPSVDPYPFVDCDSVDNAFRMCKSTSCCEAERSTSSYCQNEVYGKYGDDVVGSICWWCCPYKLLDVRDADSPVSSTTSLPTSSPSLRPTSGPSTSTQPPIITTTLPPTQAPNESSATPTGPVVVPTNPPSLNPTSPPLAATSAPTSKPSTAPVVPGTTVAPISNAVVCADLEANPDVNLGRICKQGGCCSSPRSSTDHCHEVYKLFGDDMADVCFSCCNPSREVAPPPPPHPTYPWIDCTTVENPFRMCKPNSCCDSSTPTPGFCTDTFNTYGPSMNSICWYCCSVPKELGLSDPGPMPTASPVNPPTIAPLPSPTMAPMQPITSPTQTPTTTTTATVQSMPSTPSPTTPSPVSQPPVGINPATCSDLDADPSVNLNRICKDGGCCDAVRSSTDHCHSVYEFFDDLMASVCLDCCGKQMAPAPPPHPVYPQITCSQVENPFRMCKPNSCCEPNASNSDYCLEVYENNDGNMGSICWYCCSEPKEVDPSIVSVARMLEEEVPSEEIFDTSALRHDTFLPHGIFASDVRMDPANFEPAENVEKRYIQELDAYQKRRKAEDKDAKNQERRLSENLAGDNYADVPYSPYEWMREVKTEYYYRYEGSQMVPPCHETVHYRVMKDPIRIHPVQLAELERLLAWRIAPLGSENECQQDTAGKERPGSNGDAVDLNRPLQSYSNIHRKVFCECDDWDSKFAEDIAWCSNADESSRWYDTPYNFDSGGTF